MSILDECCVCLEDAVALDEKTECGHSVCGDCLSHLTTLLCPLCRAPITPFRIASIREKLFARVGLTKPVEDTFYLLTYRELQILAKAHGIRANTKRILIVANLQRIGVKPPTPQDRIARYNILAVLAPVAPAPVVPAPVVPVAPAPVRRNPPVVLAPIRRVVVPRRRNIFQRFLEFFC